VRQREENLDRTTKEEVAEARFGHKETKKGKPGSSKLNVICPCAECYLKCGLMVCSTRFDNYLKHKKEEYLECYSAAPGSSKGLKPEKQ
jgi:hypothetical protein